MIKLPESLRNLFGTHGEPAARMTNAPLFVTGSMRSGTTFLVDKLSSHPQLLKIGVELNQVWTDIGGASIKGTCDHKVATDASAEYTYQMTALKHPYGVYPRGTSIRTPGVHLRVITRF